MEAAGRLFDARGYGATSISDIADEAGYTTGALYSNFANKEDLFLAVLEHQMADETAALRAELSAEPTVAGRLEVVGRWYASSAGRGQRRTRAVAEIALSSRRGDAAQTRLRHQRRALREAVADLLRQQEVELGIAFPLPIPTLTTAVLALLEGFALAAAFDDEGAVDPTPLVAALALMLRPTATPG